MLHNLLLYTKGKVWHRSGVWPRAWSIPLPSSARSWGQPGGAARWSRVDTTICQRALWISSRKWFVCKISQHNALPRGALPTHLQKQRRLPTEGDVEKAGKAWSRQMHTDLLAKTCLGVNIVIPLCLPSCWEVSMVSSQHRKQGVSWWHTPPQPASCPGPARSVGWPVAPTHPHCLPDLPPPCPGLGTPPCASGTTTKAAGGFLPL